jgi:hypothetical protein
VLNDLVFLFQHDLCHKTLLAKLQGHILTHSEYLIFQILFLSNYSFSWILFNKHIKLVKNFNNLLTERRLNSLTKTMDKFSSLIYILHRCEYNLNICIDCGPRRYKDSAGQCLACPATCADCTSQTVCTVCLMGYTLVQNNCTYNLDHPCAVTGTNSQCIQCFEGYRFNGSACVPDLSCTVGTLNIRG